MIVNLVSTATTENSTIGFIDFGMGSNSCSCHQPRGRNDLKCLIQTSFTLPGSPNTFQVVSLKLLFIPGQMNLPKSVETVGEVWEALCRRAEYHDWPCHWCNYHAPLFELSPDKKSSSISQKWIHLQILPDLVQSIYRFCSRI